MLSIVLSLSFLGLCDSWGSLVCGRRRVFETDILLLVAIAIAFLCKALVAILAHEGS